MSLMLLGGLSLGITYLISGLLINLLQVFTYIIVRPFSKQLQRKINYYLNYLSWSQLVNVATWWANCHVKVYYEDDKTRNSFCREHTLTIMNHRYEIDWLICWIVCDFYQTLASAKSFIKHELKKIPVIGWGWACSEMIFLKRNWEKDSKHLGQQLDNLLEYENIVNILMFSEGTRYTPEKYKAGLEFAQKRGLKELKYHLVPRTRGFVFCATHLNGKIDAIYDLQLAFPPNGPEPTFRSILMGKKLDASLYVKRIPMSSIPTDSEKECSDWLHENYQRKDQLMEKYYQTGVFPGEVQVITRRWAPLICTIVCTLSLLFPIVSLLIGQIQLGHYVAAACIIGVLLFFYISSYLFVKLTMTKHGSSYGKSKPAAETNGINKLKSH